MKRLSLLLSIAAIGLSTEIPVASADNFSGLLDSRNYQIEFNNNLSRKRYPKEVRGLCENESQLFQGKFSPYEEGKFSFQSIHGAQARKFDYLDRNLKKKGFKLIYRDEIYCQGDRRIQATWIFVENYTKEIINLDKYYSAKANTDNISAKHLEQTKAKLESVRRHFKEIVTESVKYNVKINDKIENFNEKSKEANVFLKERDALKLIETHIEMLNIAVEANKIVTDKMP